VDANSRARKAVWQKAIRRAIFFVCCSLAILASAGASYVIYSLYDQYIIRQYEKVLHQLTQMVEYEFPLLGEPDELLRLLGEDDERYWATQNTLTNLKSAYDVVYVYVVAKTPSDEWQFIMSTLYGRGTPPDEIYELTLNNNGYIDYAADTGEMVVTDRPVSDEWGTFITGYRPVVVNGETKAVICADYDVSYINALHGEARIGLIVSIVSALALSVLFAILARNYVVELELVVEGRTKDLKVQTELAQGASLAKSRFLASMSHEIRTPMNAIIGMSTLMRIDNLDDLQRDYLGGIRKMSASLLRIINDILDISKIEAGKMELVPTDFNLYELYDQVCSANLFSAAAKSLLFKSDFAADVPKVIFGDEVRVRQILTNLTSNAIKYTRKGFVFLGVALETLDGEESVVFSVADSGLGIKEENLPKLFENFQQFDQEANRGIVGTGLGLAITKQLTAMMGGTIEVQSTYGEGSQFTVKLPLVRGDENAIFHKPALPRVIASPDTKALVVDDNAINLTVALGFLSAHNIKAETALSGKEAIDMVTTKQYHIVFMDHMMPEMDGVDTAKFMRSLPGERFKSMPIIALSANAQQGARELFLESGMNDFIPKPIEARDMNAALNRWLPPELIIGRVDDDSKEHIDLGLLTTATKKGGTVAVSDTFPTVSDTLPTVSDTHASVSGTHASVSDTHVSASDTHASVSDTSQSVSGTLAKLATIPQLDVPLGISHVGGSAETYVTILGQFCEEAEGYAAELRRLLAAEDWRLYKVKIHALKGVLAAIGCMSVSDEAKALEAAAASDTPDTHEICRAGNEPVLEKTLRLKEELAGALA
jgi:signal transduction histidine kinase/HPt (histidine-containing phosphotransfer) domain-containing protein/FixJ family two-component response regulator